MASSSRDRGFVTAEAGRRLFFPALGQPRVVPSPEDEARFRCALTWTLIGSLVVWAVAGAALVYLRDWPLKSVAHGWILVVLVRVGCAILYPRRWPLADQGAIRSARSAPSVEGPAGSQADRKRLVRKAALYGLLTVILLAGGLVCAIVLPSIWDTLDEAKQARGIQTMVVSFVLSLLFGIHTLRLRHSLRRLAATGGAVSRR